MAIPEGKIFTFEPESSIRSDFLEVFPYEGEPQFIVYKTREFSCVCPFSGLPDYGELSIEHIPHQHCVELKSFKYYLTSFRNVGIYQEPVTHRIFKDIYALLNPQYLKVTTLYNTRGGIDATCSIEKGVRCRSGSSSA